MKTKSQLAIVIVTYNRAPYLEKTLAAVLAEDSPVRGCPITVFNNRSTDDTEAVVGRFAAAHANLSLVTHNFNVGGNANIAKALEACATQYHWVLCDDDKYDWSGWPAVEQAMERGEKVLCVGDRHLPDDPALRSDPAVQLQQMTFLPSIIYGPGVITATAVRNAYDSTFALFQHLVPVVMHLNAGGTIWTAPKGIVVPGDYGIDISYTRGDKREDVFNQSRTMVLSAGFAYVTANLRDRKLSKRAFAALVHSSQMGLVGFLGEVFMRLRGREGDLNFRAVWLQSPFRLKLLLWPLRRIQNSFLYPLLANGRLYAAFRGLADRKNAAARAQEHA